ncbi:hypothetical protein B566_EDAN014274 [Ephemera danica]|nr:hypothetical protein B566_EDAN014274 [Ephemera danica]
MTSLPPLTDVYQPGEAPGLDKNPRERPSADQPASSQEQQKSGINRVETTWSLLLISLLVSILTCQVMRHLTPVNNIGFAIGRGPNPGRFGVPLLPIICLKLCWLFERRPVELIACKQHWETRESEPEVRTARESLKVFFARRASIHEQR